MTPRGFVVGIYQNASEAAAVLQALRKQGQHRSALIERRADAQVRVDDLDVPPQRGAIIGACVGIALTLLASRLPAVAALGVAAAMWAVVAVALAALGGGLGWGVSRLLRFGVDERVLRRLTPVAIRGEGMVLVEVAARDSARVFDILRIPAAADPLTYAVFPEAPIAPAEEGAFVRRAPLTPDRLAQEAGRLAAAGHRVSETGRHGQPLLRRLVECERLLWHAQETVSAAARAGKALPPAAEWFLDNAYFIQGHVEDFRRNLPRAYYRELPLISEGPHAGLPRIYAIATEFVADTDARVEQEGILNFLQSYQTESPLTLGELWAVPMMLRLRLIESVRHLIAGVVRQQRESELADFWANRLLTAARTEPERLLALVAHLAEVVPDPSAHLADQLVAHLYDEESVLSLVRSWLERQRGAALGDIVRQEHRDQAMDQASLANAISSLRGLAQLDWRAVVETVSRPDAILWTDPADIYARMDFETRDRCRHAVEQIARRAKKTEIDVAMAALQRADEGTDALTRHVGYHLIDAGRPDLERSLGCTAPFAMRLQRLTQRRPGASYLSVVGAATTALLVWFAWGLASADVAWPAAALLALLALIPASELAIQVVNYLITRTLPPTVLPKMRFEEGIPDDFRTMVVVPMMLLTPEAIRDEVERLQVRYLGNPDPNLIYALLSDYGDAPSEHMPEDAELLEVAARGIEDLNERYGSGRFCLFHRRRNWCEGEQSFMGWERKRGKLEQLNAFLMGEGGKELDDMLRVGDADTLRGIRFIITLDSDTQLPPNTARRMVETLAHPLNRPVLSADGRKVERGYAILQPRVTTSLPSATASLFSWLFTDTSGLDPYSHAVSDVYQDLTGEGNYHGKGIYDLAAFHRVLSQRFPERHLLSHDLIEGVHVRAALASDVELLDLFPRSYMVFARRQHRWVRGDWQIADWLMPQVPDGHGRSVRNPLSTISRWKIFDNLRRSLMPASSVALLAAAWLLAPATSGANALVGWVFLCPVLFQMVGTFTQKSRFDRSVWRDVAITALRSAVNAALLPHQAAVNLDAIARVAHRRVVSHRHMLEWETAAESGRRAKNQSTRFLLSMTWIPVAAAALALVAEKLHPWAALACAPFVALWTLSPAIVALLDQTARPRAALELTAADRRFLRQTARLTWRFFDEFVSPASNWLPPDNYQELLRKEVAPRTSPTNVGLSLLANFAALDFGYITLDTVLDRLKATFGTLERLERFKGHLLNWYDIYTLEPLNPRYVSTVDSGNLLGDYWAVAQALQELDNQPVLTPSCLDGVEDTLELVRHLVPGGKALHAATNVHLAQLTRLVGSPPDTLQGLVKAVREGAALADSLADAVHSWPETNEAADYWAGQVRRQFMEAGALIDRYLGWAEVLNSPPDGGLLAFGSEAHEWRRAALGARPSLRALAAGDVPGLTGFLGLKARGTAIEVPAAAREWLDRLVAAEEHARWLAAERLAQSAELARAANRLADEMDMRFLYDEGRRLFHIGFNVNDLRLDGGYYDLLASECRLGSFVSIARGEVPVEHWAALGRPFGTCMGRKTMLSWSGTMFEYLMPLLLTRSFENSLLDEACRSAVTCQMLYGQRRGIPWGITEAAYSALDARNIYQYHAFGVPGLGIKRSTGDELVVAPYASALALAVAPGAAARNLRGMARLARIGLRGGYGYYESIDFTRQRGPEGERGVIVYTYMAHHQGMVLLAVDNCLNNNPMQRRFHADPRVRAAQPLLYERIPVAPPLARTYSREVPAPRLAPVIRGALTGRVDTPNTHTPRVGLLSNGAYSLMVTNAGGGYSRWKDFEIARWRSDTTRDDSGTFLYLKDVESGDVWSATYQPVTVEGSRYEATFSPGKVEFRRRDHGIETATEVVVSPEDSAEVRLVTLTNRSLRERSIELTTYLELALAPHAADRSHPAFSKLFVQTELVDGRILLAWRRPRSAGETPVWAAHVLTLQDAPPDALPEVETDRARFLGRGRTPRDPAAMHGPLSGTVGAVLDPVFSLRRRITIGAGDRAQVAAVTMAAPSREEALALAEEYLDLHASFRARDLAWTHAQLELRHLRIQGDEALRYQQLAGHVLYASPQLRPAPERLRRNEAGQSRLWSYGISGDLPIVVVTISDANDLDLVREALAAHTFWRVRGLKADLVVLNEESASYEQPLHDQLTRLVQAHTQYTGIDVPGGVFLRPIANIPEQDVTLLLSTAQVVLVAARGTLTHQFGATPSPASIPPLLRLNPMAGEEPSPPLPFMELPYFNGFGGFTRDGKEYAVYLGPGDETPLPWVNVLANPAFGTMVSESGGGFTWYGNSQSNRLTPWSNDPVSDGGGEAIYLRDDDMGTVWSPTPLPVREQDAYRARHGQGYSTFEHNSHAIEQELVMFVPTGEEDLPVKLQRLRLTNRSSHRRRLSLTYYIEWALGTTREETANHIVPWHDVETQAIFARNPYHADYGGRVAFAGCSHPVTSYTGDRTAFLGRNGSLHAPEALRHERLYGHVEAGLDPCAALQTQVVLEPDQRVEVVFVLGQAADADEARALLHRFSRPGEFDRSLASTREWWEHTLQAVQVDTPIMSVNFLLNRWLPYQALSCRIWGRSAFYQSGGAFGFRDQLQDSLAMLFSHPELTREQLLRSAERQFVEGDVQHWWHPPSGAGVRTRISDDLLWLPFVTAQYVRVTGDADILNQVVPFIQGKTLDKGEHESYFMPSVSQQSATLLEHCRRAIERGATQGRHGLPLIGGGDWNDGLNRVGIEGKGESVWLAWFLVHVYHDFSELLERTGDEKGAADYRVRARALAAAIEDAAWDGAWYRRAYYDDGATMGSAGDDEAKIDSIAQSWSVLSGLADQERSALALQSAWHWLVSEPQRLVKLFTPAFDKSEHDPGYIKGYLPGVRENGGQYTHGSLWLPMAFARQGDGERAVRLLQLMSPVEHARTREDALRYKVEPYVVAADVYSLKGQEGRGGWTWYTGSASWMYRVWVEEVLGLQVRGGRMRLAPVIPAAWPGFSLQYRHGGTVYAVEVQNAGGGEPVVTVDGAPVPDGWIELVDDGRTRQVRVVLGGEEREGAADADAAPLPAGATRKSV